MKAVEVNQEGFCNRRKTKAKENVGSVLNRKGPLVTQDMGKTETLNEFFTSAFTSEASLWKAQVLATRGKVWSKEILSLVEEDQIKEY